MQIFNRDDHTELAYRGVSLIDIIESGAFDRNNVKGYSVETSGSMPIPVLVIQVFLTEALAIEAQGVMAARREEQRNTPRSTPLIDSSIDKASTGSSGSLREYEDPMRGYWHEEPRNTFKPTPRLLIAEALPVDDDDDLRTTE